MDGKSMIHEITDLVIDIKSKTITLMVDSFGVHMGAFTKDIRTLEKYITAWNDNKDYEDKLNEMLEYLKGVEK